MGVLSAGLQGRQERHGVQFVIAVGAELGRLAREDQKGSVLVAVAQGAVQVEERLTKAVSCMSLWTQRLQQAGQALAAMGPVRFEGQVRE